MQKKYIGVSKVDHIERNYQIIQQVMINQMERSFAIGRELIDTELDAGLLNFIVKPIVKAFYSYWTDKDARQGTLEQIRVTLDCGKELVTNGNLNSREAFDKAIEKYFPIYLKNDQTYRQCSKNHKNFKSLVEITRDCFITQVEETVLFFQVDKDDISTYDQLCKEVFKTKEAAHKSLMLQLDYNEAGIKVVEKDPAILKIITGKKIIVRTLRKGFEITKKELLENLHNSFN
jgi:hypothetical protein